MKLVYHFAASKELDEAFEWYEAQRIGLGLQFVHEVELSIKRILNFPFSNPVLAKEFRRAVLPVFPYGIFYKILEDSIAIFAIGHLHRKPNYWIRRK